MPSDTATTSGASYATADDNLQSRPGHVAIDIPEADERPDDTASTSGTSYATANDSLQGRPGHVTVDIPEADISDALYPPADAGAAAQPAAADNAGANQPSAWKKVESWGKEHPVTTGIVSLGASAAIGYGIGKA